MLAKCGQHGGGVIPTGATRFFLARGPCAPGRGAEESLYNVESMAKFNLSNAIAAKLADCERNVIKLTASWQGVESLA